MDSAGRKGDAWRTLAGRLIPFLAGIRQDVVTALLAPGKWVWGLLRRRRERKDYERIMHILTRQGTMPALDEVSPMCYTSRHEEIDRT